MFIHYLFAFSSILSARFMRAIWHILLNNAHKFSILLNNKCHFHSWFTWINASAFFFYSHQIYDISILHSKWEWQWELEMEILLLFLWFLPTLIWIMRLIGMEEEKPTKQPHFLWLFLIISINTGHDTFSSRVFVR